MQTIKVRQADNLFMAECPQGDYLGASPDEALGAAVRDIWLQSLTDVITITLDLENANES
ncbi:MAG TPA: hypothetical protein VMY37_36070 [Thermoguttaceae bacterium]|nr:hypothetical protein [Thermoguttaceae bacterium]